jgi:hypothetical protein
VAVVRIQTMRRLHRLSVVGFCLAMAGCASNIGALQGKPVVEYQNGSQSRAEIRSSDKMTGTVDSAGSPERTASEIFISDLSTGRVSKVEFDKSVADSAITIHNGSGVSVQVQTQSNVTGVLIDGDALTPTPLRRTSSGHWQGTFQYWDGSNIPNSKSKMTLLLISTKRSIGKTFLVTTVHDS